MKLVFLGTGTSVGVPMIGCDCAVCRSGDPHNRRRRTSLYLQAGGCHVIVDTTPDFREQVLQYKVPRVDAVFFTHSHADHIFGFDDIRRFNSMQQSVIPAYAAADTLDDLLRIYNYVDYGDEIPGVFRPRSEFRPMDGPVTLDGLCVTPVAVEHGPTTTRGYVFEAEGRRVGYIPDCKAIPEEAYASLRDLDIMVLDGLRHRPHRTHLTVEESVAALQRIGAAQSYIIHLCHDLDHAETQAGLPAGIDVSYDGLSVDVQTDGAGW